MNFLRKATQRLETLGLPLDADGYVDDQEKLNALIDLLHGYASWMHANYPKQVPHRDNAEEWLNDNCTTLQFVWLDEFIPDRSQP